MSNTYFCELILGFSLDQNQTTAEIFSGQLISIIIKKVEISQRGTKMSIKGGASFTKMAITPERNEVSSPNFVHMCQSSIFGQIK